MVDGFMEKGLVIEYVLYQVHYEMFFYSLPFTVCYFIRVQAAEQ